MRFARLPALAALAVVLGAASACSSSASPPSTSTPIPRPSGTPLASDAFPPPPHGKAFTATLVTDVGGLNDRSFNHASWLGLQEAHRQLKITPVVAQPATGAAYLPALVKAAQHYSTLTVAVGYSMAPALFTAANEFPRARFAIVDARPLDGSGREVSLRNVENLLFKEQEAGYLVGVLAGLMERDRVDHATHNTIGYLGGTSIPAVNHYLAGYVAGARSVDPGIKIVGTYAGSFTDTATGARLAVRQIDQGADILFEAAGPSGQSYLQAAGAHGAYGIGSDSDQSFLGPFVLTSAIKKVSVAVRTAVRATMAGRFRGGDHRLGAAQGAINFSRPASIVPRNIVAQVARTRRAIAGGSIVPPTTLASH